MSGPWQDVIHTRSELRETVAAPSRLVADKVIDHVDDYCREFIAASPFMVLTSTNSTR